MEHIAQPNQYFLVTVGVALRNKPSLMKHTHRITVKTPTTTTWENSSQREEVCVLGVIGCRSICLSQHSCLMTLIIELLFRTSLLLPTASASSHSFPLHIPWCCYCCDIFLSSIPEVIWLVKLHLFPHPPTTTPPPWRTPLRFPVWVAAITLVLSLDHDLGGQHRLQSILMEMTHIYHHGDNLWTAVCRTRPEDSADPLLDVHTLQNVHGHTRQMANSPCGGIFVKMVGLFCRLMFGLLPHCEGAESQTRVIWNSARKNSRQINLLDVSVTSMC